MAFEIYQFPLASDQEYKGKISFKATQEEFGGLLDLVTESSRPAVDGVGTDTDANGFNGTNPALQTVQTGEPSVIQQGKVTLYLPPSLQFSDAVNYSGTHDLGYRGELIRQGLRAGQTPGQIASLAARDFADTAGALWDAVTGGQFTEAVKIAAVRVSSRPGSAISGAVSSGLGITVNPNRRSIMESVPIRQFQFQFKLIPTTESESTAINNIIRWFRENMYPEATGDGGASIAFKFPSKFDINMTYDGQPIATKILPCFLTGVTTVYNGSSMGMHAGGRFQEIDLTLMFMEERALDKAKIIEGY